MVSEPASLCAPGAQRAPSPSCPSRMVSGCALAVLLVAGAHAQKPAVEILTVDDGLPSPIIFDLDQDPSGRLWILSRAGIAVYDGHDFNTYGGSDGLPTEPFAALDVDAGGRVRAVTRSEARVYTLEGSDWRGLPEMAENDSLKATSLTAFTAAGQTSVVVGTSDHGLSIWDGRAWRRCDVRRCDPGLIPVGVARDRGLPSDRVGCLARFDGWIAVGTDGGLCRLAGGELDCRVWDHHPWLADAIFALYPEAGTTPRLWMLAATWLGYLERDRLTIVADGLDPRFSPESRATIAVAGGGGVFFGSPEQAYFFDPVESRVRKLGMREGLATEGSSAILPDRESNVWVGSPRGLARIGSQRFWSYDRDQGLHEAEVSAIVEPVPGHFILGHNTGLTFLTADGAETVDFEQPHVGPLGVVRVLDMAVDGGGEVWLATQALGLLRLGADRSWTAEPLPGEILSVEIGADGRLWVAGHHELFVRTSSGFVTVDVGFDVDSLRWLTTGLDGRLYVSSRDGLLILEGNVPPKLARGPTSEADNVYGVFAEPSGTVWVGTGAGLYRLEGDRLRKVGQGELAIDRPIYLILKDARGRLWFGTDDGVEIWDGDHLRHLTVRHGLAGRETNRGAGLVDHIGRVWIGTDQGLSVYQERWDTPRAVPPNVEIKAVEVGGRLLLTAEDVHLIHHQSTLTFHLNTIFFSREEGIEYRWMLEGFDHGWQGPSPLSGSEIRYTNLPPGRFSLRIAARWASGGISHLSPSGGISHLPPSGGAWSRDATSAAIEITQPVWRRPWFLLLVVVAFAVVAGHAIRTRAVRARNLELEQINLELAEQIEQRRRAEADRGRMITELAAKNVERGQLIDELEARNVELERFLYTVSHDLKSPLVTIKGFVGLLRKDAAAGDAARMHRDVERISAAAGTMGRQLDELLELSRIGRMINPPETTAFGELVREALDPLSDQIAERGVRVSVDSELPEVTGDRARLLEVVQHLIENAVKFTGEQSAPRIEIGMRQASEPDGPVFYVRDNGIGIEPRFREKVFGLFERLDQTVEGTGVGLAIVKRIVELHGGRIWVESRGLGQGATFCFTLPFEAEPRPDYTHS